MRISLARRGAVVLALGLLAGCGSSGIQVERVAQLPADSGGARFMMLTARTQDNDPSHAQLAELVAAQLAARNFVRVTEPAEARFAVMVWERRSGPGDAAPPRAASTSDSQTPSRGRMGGGGGGFGGGGMGGGGRRGRPSNGMPPSEESGQPSRRTHLVQIRIYDLTRPHGPDQRVFDSRAEISSADGRASTETLIAAALRDFPGRAQETYSVPVTR